MSQEAPDLPIWEPTRSTAALPLLFSSLLISMYTISLAGSNSENLLDRANTCARERRLGLTCNVQSRQHCVANLSKTRLTPRH